MQADFTDIFWFVVLVIGSFVVASIGVRSILRARNLRRLGRPPEVIGAGTEVGIIALILAGLWMLGGVLALLGVV